ncbi:chalcone isomerase family protein [soil metagenome]
MLWGAGCALVAVPTLASAQPMAPSVAPAAMAAAAQLRDALPDAQRLGTARLTVWGFQVYDAVLWVGSGFQASAWMQQPIALELRYLRDFEGTAIAKRSIDEMRRSGPIEAAQSERWLQAMQATFPDVKKGDRLLGVYEPGTGARFFHNGKPSGAVRDPAFAERFFAIWLGAQTSEPAMRDALLAR